MKLPFTHSGVNVNLNVSNLFDQDTITDENHAPYRDKLIAPGQSTAGSSTQLSVADQFFFNGFDVNQVVSTMRASGATMRDNPLFLRPSSFLGRRSIRFGVKWTF